MTEGIEPFLEEIKGEKLAFYTNTKGNVYFYTKNGYKEVYSSEISFNQVEMGSWYFLKELKKTLRFKALVFFHCSCESA